MGFDEGYAFGKELAARRIARKDALTDEQHADQRDKLIDARTNLQTQLASYKDAKGNVIPEFKDQYDKASAASAQNEYDFGQLYDPIKAPGRLQQDWHYLRERIHGIKQPTPTTQAPRITATEVPGVAASTMPGMAGAPITIPATGSTPEMTLPASTPAPITTPEIPAYKQISVAPAPPPPPTWGQAQVLKKRAAAMQKAQEEAKTLEAGAGLSPEQQAAVDARKAMAKFKSDEAVRQAQNDAALATAEKLGITGPALEEFKQQLAGLKNVSPKPLTGAAGQPYKGEDGLYYQSVSNPDGSIGRRAMNPDWKPNRKVIAGTLLNTKQHGFIKTWVYADDPSKIAGWQKITPSRYYQGTKSTKTTTDTAGVTTTSSGTTMPTNTTPVDIDLSGVEEHSEDYNGEDMSGSPAAEGQTPSTASTATPTSGSSASKTPAEPNSAKPSITAKPGAPVRPSPAKKTATPAELKKQIPAPPQDSPTAGKPLETDAQGHIPENAVDVSGKPINPQIREAANQLMDGVDMKDVTLPVKDKPTAEAVARKYGWGRGPYLPRELKQMQNAKQFLDQALNSKAFMKAIDDGFWRKFQTAEAEHDASKSGLWDTAAHVLSINNLTPEQQEYLTIRQALMGTVSGLSSVVRTGKATEATINRLAQEIPDVMSSSNSKMAKEKIGQIMKELDVALAQGVPAPTTKNKGNTENNPSDGNTPSLSVVDQWRASHGATHP